MHKINIPEINSLPRLFLATFLISSLFVIYIDIWPMLSGIDEIKEKMNNAQQQLQEKQAALQTMVVKAKMFKPNGGLSEGGAQVITAVSKSGASVRYFRIKSSEMINDTIHLTIQLQLTGNFLSIYQFWSNLWRQKVLCQLQAMHIKQQGDTVEISAEFNAFYHAAEYHLPELNINCCKRDPFHMPALMDTDVHEVKIEEIHYVGYMRDGDAVDGLILLANGNLLSIQQGFIIGKDNWKVLGISPYKITLIHPVTHQLKIIEKEENKVD